MGIPLADDIKTLVRGANFAHLATLMPDGSPQVASVWVDLEGDRRARELEAAVVAHSGMFPCLRAGTVSRLVESIRSALIRRGRVSAGSITSSMNPRSAAM